MNAQGQTICLNMIVKDEASVIRRCLDSVRPLIDAWVIADTGSTDGTQDVIRELLSDVPGALLERPWVDFAHNRTEVLEASRGRCDYSLIIDADDVLEIDAGFVLPSLDADAYIVPIRYGSLDSGSLDYHRKQLVRSALPWRYVGVVHEYIECDLAQTEAFLHGVRMLIIGGGSRSRDPLVYQRDASLLEKALRDEPTNMRYVFYLAQSYRDAGDLERALLQYRRRATMGGWRDEVWYSLYQIARLKSHRNAHWPDVLAAYLTAVQCLPDRAEPLYWIAMHYQNAGEFHVAQGFFEWALACPKPSSTSLFVERAIHDYLLELEYAVCCCRTGAYHQAIEVTHRLLSRDTLPAELVDLVKMNGQLGLDALQCDAHNQGGSHENPCSPGAATMHP